VRPGVDGARAVLCVTPFIWEGGAGRGKPTVYYALRGFQRAGYDVHVVTATNRADLVSAVIDGIQIHYFRVPLSPFGFDYDVSHSFLTRVRADPRPLVRHLKFRLWWSQFVLCGARRAGSVARRTPPAFTYGVNNPGVPVAWWVGRRLGVPSFARIMGSEIGQRAGVDLDDAPAGTPVAPGRVKTLKLWLARFDELLAFKLPSDAVIVTDDGQIGPRTITDWLGVPSERLWLWRNGIDRERFASLPDRAAARAALDIASERPVVLWVSQLIDWKQPGLLIDAVPAVLTRVPDALFLLVGDGPERATLIAQSERLGVAEHVRFDGFVAQDRVPLYYRGSDVFTALYRTANVSNTLLEAMVSGLAVVTLDNGRTREVVRHEVSGLLVAPDRPDDIAPALARALGNGDLRRRLGEGAMRWTEGNLLSWDDRVRREVDAIEAVVARRAVARQRHDTPHQADRR
jgi:glycosyltransferase involved in cell wall biosynthesis